MAMACGRVCQLCCYRRPSGPTGARGIGARAGAGRENEGMMGRSALFRRASVGTSALPSLPSHCARAMPDHPPRLLILYGSETGTAQVCERESERERLPVRRVAHLRRRSRSLNLAPPLHFSSGLRRPRRPGSRPPGLGPRRPPRGRVCGSGPAGRGGGRVHRGDGRAGKRMEIERGSPAPSPASSLSFSPFFSLRATPPPTSAASGASSCGPPYRPRL